METKSTIRSEIVRLFGTLDDHNIREIIGLEPSFEDLEVTAAYLTGMDDIMGKERLPLTGVKAMIFDIVSRDEVFADDEYTRN
jgi:hypothetical protein